MMDDESNRFTFEQHTAIGENLKLSANNIEKIKTNLQYSYPKSGKKELRQLETVLNNVKSIQTSLHGRLLNEFPEKSDDELLPVYLGRYQLNY